MILSGPNEFYTSSAYFVYQALFFVGVLPLLFALSLKLRNYFWYLFTFACVLFFSLLLSMALLFWPKDFMCSVFYLKYYELFYVVALLLCGTWYRILLFVRDVINGKVADKKLEKWGDPYEEKVLPFTSIVSKKE
jgi:hypothetical protein